MSFEGIHSSRKRPQFWQSSGIFCMRQRTSQDSALCHQMNVKVASQEALQEIAKNGKKLYERWQKCIVAYWDYFEGGYALVL
ncbi:hypothetical protein TNCV_301061 [Trichonephila clavipes]|nr:hypothetical protein TNCV_301061 [Trichonephila clavipes]